MPDDAIPQPLQNDVARGRGVSARIRAEARRLIERGLSALNRIHLPGPSVLPAAGAVVGLYAGLAAGLFANLIALMSGLVFGAGSASDALRPGSHAMTTLWEAFAETDWHAEYAIVGAPIAAGALFLAKLIEPGEARDEVKRRLRILALLVLGALGLYYPLVALSAVNTLFGHTHDLTEALQQLPWWMKLAAPTVGAMAVGYVLRNHPETHGHGVPEVVMAVKRGREGLPAQGGVLKLFASAITIGSGGSAGREGPIVFGGAAFASEVGRILGFSRKELGILLACGAGAGISASFNAPIAGAIFALEIILREFELKVFSPIILASVTATMVGRGLMGETPTLRRIGYQMVSGWEILFYIALGLVTGLVAYAFVRMLHHSEGFFAGRVAGKLSPWLGSKALPIRAAIGGSLVGLMVLVNPVVWGTGTEFVNLAMVRQLGFWFLLAAAVLKLLATSITIGSGSSGGTFFPSMVIGAMTGGAFGELIHALFPLSTAPSGAYAMVGMAGGVAAFTRGPLTAMMMLYELSGNYAIILPLMVTCTISSALCHALVERRTVKTITDAELLTTTAVRRLLLDVPPVPANTRLRDLADHILGAEEGAVVVLDTFDRPYGIVQAEYLRDVWRDESMHPLLVAIDLAHRLPAVSADTDCQTALALMDEEDVDALPVIDAQSARAPFGLITRASIRRMLFRAHAHRHERGEHAVAATEVVR